MAIDENDITPLDTHQEIAPTAGSDMSMMRIAIAGTGGLARFIAHFIEEETAHQVIFLSRTMQPQLTASEYQVAVVDYNDLRSLAFALRGVDTVISTVTGPNQIELIRAAVAVRVRRFAAAEFEGLPQLRPLNDPLDRYRAQALRLLSTQNVESTVFVCGILYERFQPGGLRQSRIGNTLGFSGEGDYMMDCRNMRAQIPAYDVNNHPNVTLCMTAAQDVGRFVTKAIDLPEWPSEMRMYGQRIAVKDLVAMIQQLKRQIFEPIQWHSPSTLRSELQVATAQQDYARTIRLHTLIATAEGRYDFSLPDLNRSLNHRFPDIRPIPFQDWFINAWNVQR